MRYFIITFGCAANEADSERIAGYYKNKAWVKARSAKTADEVIIVTCMVRQSAEDRITGVVRNIGNARKGGKPKIIISGCMAGMAIRDTSGKLLQALQKRMPYVDQFVPIEEIGCDNFQVRTDKHHALVSISNGCNNFCSYCVVPYGRGREVSRSFEEIIHECQKLAKRGYTSMTLLGQNVNSYGSDLIQSSSVSNQLSDKNHITYVKHLGKMRIPTLFPYLLTEICKIDGIKEIDFFSSNPWDFSDELIDVIAGNKKIKRQIHLPVQSGSDEILKKMNRWYTGRQYLELIRKIREKVPEVTFSTDIIVGFPGETEEQFQHTVELCKKVGFVKAYVAMYSDRPMTDAHKNFPNTLPYPEKKRRWGILENLINTNTTNTTNATNTTNE